MKSYESKKKLFSFKRKNSILVKKDYESIIINILSNQQEKTKYNKEKSFKELIINKKNPKIKTYSKRQMTRNISLKSIKIPSMTSYPLKNQNKKIATDIKEKLNTNKNNKLNECNKCKNTYKMIVDIPKIKNTNKKETIDNISKYSHSKINNNKIENLKYKNNFATINNKYKTLYSIIKLNSYNKKSNLKLNFKQLLNNKLTKTSSVKNNKTLKLPNTLNNSKRKNIKMKNYNLTDINLNGIGYKNTENTILNNQCKKKYAIPIVSANIIIETHNLTNNNSRTIENEKHYSKNIIRRHHVKKLDSFKIKRELHLMKRYNSTKQISDLNSNNFLDSDNNIDLLNTQKRKLEEIQNELEKNKSDELSGNIRNYNYMNKNNIKKGILDNEISSTHYRKRGILLNVLRKMKSNTSKKNIKVKII